MLNNVLMDKIGFGGVKLSVMPTLGAALKILETAFDNGIRYFDTAPLYGSGYSEKIIGKFASGKRDKVIIATKVGLNPSSAYKLSPTVALPLNYVKRLIKKPVKNVAGESAVLEYRLITKEYVKNSFENTLRNLKTDYINNYLLHEALPSFLDDEACAYLMELKAKKLIHNLGVATASIIFFNSNNNFDNWDILQYDYNSNYNAAIYDNFPKHIHILHSILSAHTQSASMKNPGNLIAGCLKKTNADKILFSTSSQKHLLENINCINSFYHS